MAESLEFQVIQALSLNADEEDEDIAKTDYYICHICNLDIPKPFIKDHELSPIHGTNLKIAVNATERLTKHKNQEINFTSTEDVGDNYFCDACMKEVKVSYRQSHEKSSHHVNSLTYEEILDDLSKLYLYDVDEIDVRRISNSSITKIQQVKALSSHIMDSNTYIKVLQCLNEVQPINIIKSINKDFLEITATNGYRIKVSMNHFHSYVFVSSNEVLCKVCSPCEGLKLTGLDIEAHKFTMGHMRRIMTLVEDMQCMRRLSANFLHCVHCNQILENTPSRVRAHIKCNSDHINKLEHFVERPVAEPFPVVLGKGSNKRTVLQMRCHVCRINVDKTCWGVHLGGKKHKRMWVERSREGFVMQQSLI